MINFLKSNKKLSLEIFLLCLIIGIGVYFRLQGLIKNNLWYDEIASYSVAVQAFPFGIIEKLAEFDTHAPFYYFILHFWIKLFGNNELALRFLSVLFGVLCIAAVYFLGKKFFSAKAGLIAAALLSVNSMQIYYSQEIRFYTYVSFLSIISIYFFLNLLKNANHKNYAFFLLASLFFLYSSNFAQFIVFIESLILLTVFLYRKNFSEVKRLFGYLFLCFIFYIPHLFLLFSQVKNFSGGFLTGFINENVLLLIGFQFLNLIIPFYNVSPVFFEACLKLQKLLPEIAFFIVLPLIIFVIAAFKALKENKTAVILALFSILFFLMEIILALNGKMPVIYKYAIFISPIVLLVWAYGISVFQKKVLTGFFLAGSLGIYLYYLIFTPFAPMYIPRGYFVKKTAIVLKKLDFTEKDFILPLPEGGCFFKDFYSSFYGINSRGFDFSLQKQLSLKNYENLKFLGSKEFVSSLNEKNSNEKLLSFLKRPFPAEEFNDFVKEKFLDKIPSGSRIAVYFPKDLVYSRKRLNNYVKKPILREKEHNSRLTLNRSHLNVLFTSRFVYNFIEICDKNLNLVNSIENSSLKIYIYEK